MRPGMGEGAAAAEASLSRRQALRGLGATAMLLGFGGLCAVEVGAEPALPVGLEVDLRDAPLAGALYLVLLAAGLRPAQFAVTRHVLGELTLATVPGLPEPPGALLDRMLAAAVPPGEAVMLRRRVDSGGVWHIEAVDGAGTPMADGTVGLRGWEPPQRRELWRPRGSGMRTCGVAMAGDRPAAALLEFRGPTGWLPMVVRRARPPFVPPLHPRSKVSVRTAGVWRIRRTGAELSRHGEAESLLLPLHGLKEAAAAPGAPAANGGGGA